MSGSRSKEKGAQRSELSRAGTETSKLHKRSRSIKSAELTTKDPNSSISGGINASVSTLPCDDYAEGGGGGGGRSDRSDFTPNCPKAGDKPHELLQRLYNLWPTQLTASYRPPACPNPEATSEYNLRFIRDMLDTEGKFNAVMNKKKTMGKNQVRESCTAQQIARKASQVKSERSPVQ